MNFSLSRTINSNTHDLLTAIGFKKIPPNEICPAVEAWNNLRLPVLRPTILGSYFNKFESTAASVIIRNQDIADRDVYIISLDLNLVEDFQIFFGKPIPAIVSEDAFLWNRVLGADYPINLKEFQEKRLQFAKDLAATLSLSDDKKTDREASNMPIVCNVVRSRKSKYGPD